MKTLFCFFLIAIGALQVYGQSFVNASLEAWAVPAVCETNTPPDGWTDYSNVGIGPDEGTLTICPSTIPPNAANGNTYARCLAGNPNTGEGMYQFVSGFIPGNSYIISYRFCGSNLWGGSGDCVWHLFIDDIDVNQSAVFSSGSSAWQTNSYTFIAILLTHKIGLRAYTPTFNGGGSAAIDNFAITESEPTGIENNFTEKDISVFPNPAKDKLAVSSRQEAVENIKIFSTTGKKVFQSRALHPASQITIDIHQLASGIYLAEAFFDNGSVKRIRFIKE